MSVRSLNKAMLIGNLTRDPELRYTPSGTAVCSFGVATNRAWTTDSGEKREETEFHRIVSWNKLAELCSQLLTKGRKVFVEGRLQTRSWQGQDGTQRTTTEIVIEDMIILDSRRMGMEAGGTDQTRTQPFPPPVPTPAATANDTVLSAPSATDAVSPPTSDSGTDDQKSTKEKEETKAVANEDINPDDIPF